MEVELKWVTDNAVAIIEYAARMCYDSHDKVREGSAAKLVRACINKGHYSIIEHASASFVIEGISRACLAQLTRHRMFSYCVRSQRYCLEDGYNYVVPDSIAEDGAALSIYERGIHNTKETYEALIARGVPREDARYVLPNAWETELVMTGNFRMWMEFIPKREHRAAQDEIRELAGRVHEQLARRFPEVFGQ